MAVNNLVSRLNGIQKVKGLDLSVEPSCTKLCGVPPPHHQTLNLSSRVGLSDLRNAMPKQKLFYHVIPECLSGC